MRFAQAEAGGGRFSGCAKEIAAFLRWTGWMRREGRLSIGRRDGVAALCLRSPGLLTG